MVQLQEGEDQWKAAGIQVVGISYDPVETLKRFAQQSGVKFPLLSDRQSKVIDAYRLRNHDVPAGSRQDGIPHPATVLVDQQGKVRAVLRGTVVRRHTVRQLLEAARAASGR